MTYLRWNAPGPYEIVFTTRVGGVSEGRTRRSTSAARPATRWSASTRTAVARAREIGADAARLALNYQMHTALVRRATSGARGEVGDGLWTDEPDLPVLAMSADCLPVALARANGRERPPSRVVHAGWRGLLAGVVESACRPSAAERSPPRSVPRSDRAATTCATTWRIRSAHASGERS